MRAQLWAVLNWSASPHTAGTYSTARYCTRVRVHARDLAEAHVTTAASVSRGDDRATESISAARAERACTVVAWLTTSAFGTYERRALAARGRWTARHPCCRRS